jgi:hypothetical protein
VVVTPVPVPLETPVVALITVIVVEVVSLIGTPVKLRDEPDAVPKPVTVNL